MEEKTIAYSKAIVFKLKYLILLGATFVGQNLVKINRYAYYLDYVKSNNLTMEYLRKYKQSVTVTQLATALADTQMKSLIWIFGICYVVIILFWLYGLRTEIIVSDKRIYGRDAFGKRVDLPIDSVSSVKTTVSKGIVVSSFSGKVKFPYLRSQKVVYDAISKLLIERQNKPVVSQVSQEKEKTPVISNAEEIKKYKELFDLGIISQVEYDAKKKEYLDL